MNAKTVAVVVIRGLALWVAISVLRATDLVRYWLNGRINLPAVLSGTVLPLATAAVLWSWAEWLASRVVPSGTDAAGDVAWTSADLLRLAVAVVGIATLAWAIPEVAWQASVIVSLNWSRNTLLGPSFPADARAQYWDIERKARLVAALVHMIVGLVLLLKPSVVSRLVGRAELPKGTEAQQGRGAAEQGDEADDAR